MSERLPLLANAFGIPHAWGILPTREGERVSEPVGLPHFVSWTRTRALEGIDVPWSADFRSQYRECTGRFGPFRVVLEAGVFLEVPDNDLRSILEDAKMSGAKVVRFLISRNLCGQRSEDALGWNARLCRTIDRLRGWLPLFEEQGVAIAVENHQDAGLDDLLRMIGALGDSPAFGICFDTGNPLSVGESPTKTLEAVAPWVRHVHLKDYTVHFAESGFRLVRCAAGSGVIDFPSVFEILANNPDPKRVPSIEIAAQQARNIPFVSADWLLQRGPIRPESLAELLGTVWSRCRRSGEEWRTPWENGASSAEIVDAEWTLLDESVDFFLRLLNGRKSKP